MSVPAYPDYKDSGVAWLGHVPLHWELTRVGAKFWERRAKVSDTDYPALSVTKNGIVPQLDTAAKTDDNDNRKCVLAGDFVINSRSDRNGSSGLSDLDGSVSLINTVIRAYDGMDGRFIHHLFRSVPFQQEYYRFGKGIVADLWSTNYGEMKAICLAVPTEAEQQAIATFLDRETAKIDALIAEQERLIALLKEKRQAVISHAVTKGLNPDAPLKVSGIEWLGKIPAHWEVKRLRHVANLNPSKSEIADLDSETEVSFLPMETIGEDGTLSLDRTRPIAEVMTGYTYFREGDVTIAKITPCFENGKGAVMRDLIGGVGFGTTELIVLRPVQSAIVSAYLDWIFRTHPFRALGEGSMYGAGGQKRVPDDFVRDFAIGLPATDEQAQIVDYLDKIAASFDALSAEAQSAITLLQERRAALISAAVTGKIDVRELIDHSDMAKT